MSSDILFTTIENHQLTRGPWGNFLDAGTGVYSLKWIQKLETTSITAITADPSMSSQVQSEAGSSFRSGIDRILLGNWMDDKFAQSLGKFDTILADYLIGAVEGFSPYMQDIILERLSKHLAPGGTLYIVGMNPIPDVSTYPANVVSEVRRARDSCILLAGHKPYREFPLEWTTRHLLKFGYKINMTKSFTILHSLDSITRQLKVAQSKLSYFSENRLRDGMRVYLNDLEERIKVAVKSTDTQRIPLSFDYVIAAELATGADRNTSSRPTSNHVMDSPNNIATTSNKEEEDVDKLVPILGSMSTIETTTGDATYSSHSHDSNNSIPDNVNV